jgi:soluble lytic murein transglycosylase
VRKLLVVVPLALVLCLAFSAAAGARTQERSQAGLYRQVLTKARANDFAAARRLAAQAHSVLLNRLVDWMDYTSGGSAASFATITGFMTAYPDWPSQIRLEAGAERAIGSTTPPAEILSWFVHRQPITIAGATGYADALLGAGKTAAAIAVLRHTWIADNFGPIQERAFYGKYHRYLGPKDNWLRLDRLLWDGHISAARRMLLRVDRAHRLLAQARIALQDDRTNPNVAIAAVPAFLRTDPGLIFDRVRWRQRNDYDDQAIDLLLRTHYFGDHVGRWWRQRAILARKALQEGMVSRAYEVAAENGLAPDSRERPDAEFLSGWIALEFLNDRKVAASHFHHLWDLTHTPISRARAAYWSGRAAQALGDGKTARFWYRRGARYVTTYYGQLAALRLGRRPWPLPAAPRPTEADRHWFDRRALTGVVRLLDQAHQPDLVAPFIFGLDGSARTVGEHVMVARLAAEVGRPDLGVAIARHAAGKNMIMVKMGWPVLRLPLGRDPERALVLALIRQESSFHTSALSGAGARGLMQLLPATARRMARVIRVSYSTRKLDDPSFNVRLGSVYLKRMVSDFGGSYILALAAYNAGPTRVRQWIKQYGDPREADVNVVDWIEMIPFHETRNYVQRVMENVEVYRQRLNQIASGDLATDLKRRTGALPGK